MFSIHIRRWLCLPIIFMMAFSHAYAAMNYVKQNIQHQHMMQHTMTEHHCHQATVAEYHHAHVMADCHSKQQAKQSCIDACKQWNCQMNIYFEQLPAELALFTAAHGNTTLNFYYHSQYPHQPNIPLLRPPKA